MGPGRLVLAASAHVTATVRSSRLAANAPLPPALVEAEPDDGAGAQEVLAWSMVYRQLVALQELDLAAGRPGARSRLERARRRLEFWSDRLLQLERIEFDAGAGVVRFGARSMALSPREQQLMTVLSEHPGDFFTAEDLLRIGWRRPELAPDQVRGYIGKLRRKLRELGLPVELENRSGRGYRLTFR